MNVSPRKDIILVFHRIDRTLCHPTVDFSGQYLVGDPRILLRCFEEKSFLPQSYRSLGDDHDGNTPDFLSPLMKDILSQRNVAVPAAFVGSILDEVYGTDDRCQSDQSCFRICSLPTGRACGKTGWYLPHGTQRTPNLYSEKSMFIFFIIELLAHLPFRLGIPERDARNPVPGVFRISCQCGREATLQYAPRS